MIPISNDFIKLFKRNLKQDCTLTIVTLDNNTYTIGGDYVLQGGLSIDRYCVTSSKLEFGNAIASELTLRLDNSSKYFNNINLQGAKVSVTISIGTNNLDVGLFHVDSVEKQLDTITVKALDSLILFDVEIQSNAFFIKSGTILRSVTELLQACCTAVGISLNSSFSQHANVTYTPTVNIWTKGITYRKVIQLCAEIMGCNAYIDKDNKLAFASIPNSYQEISLSDRFSSEIAENNITIEGIGINLNGVKSKFPLGSDYIIEYTDNYLFTGNQDALLYNIYDSPTTFNQDSIVYRPCVMTIKSAPYLLPMDKIKFKDKNNVDCYGILTHVTYTINRNTQIQANGLNDIQESYAALPVKYVTSSDLSDSNNENYKKITTITEDTIETTNVIAQNLLVQNVLCKDSNNVEIFKVDSANHIVRIANSWEVTKDLIYSKTGGQIIVENLQQDMYKFAIGVNYDDYQLNIAGKPAMEVACPFNTVVGDTDGNIYIPLIGFRSNGDKLYYLCIFCPYGTVNVTNWQLRVFDQNTYSLFVEHQYTDTF